MKKSLVALFSTFIIAFSLVACSKQPATAEPTSTEAPTGTPIVTEVPTNTPTAVPTSTPTSTPTAAPTNTSTPTPAPDKSNYNLISDKLCIYKVWTGNGGDYAPGPMGELYSRDIENNGKITRELTVWNEDYIVWTNTEPANKIWLVETERGPELLMLSLKTENSKVLAHYQLGPVGTFQEPGGRLIDGELISKEEMSTEFYLASDGKTPVSASLSTLDIGNFIESLQRHLTKSELVYSAPNESENSNINELYSYFQTPRDMNADSNKFNATLKAIADNMPIDSELNIPATNTTANALVTGRYTGYFTRVNQEASYTGRRLTAKLNVTQNFDTYYIELALERLALFDILEAKCENGVIEGYTKSYPELKLKLTFSDDIVYIELFGNENYAYFQTLEPMTLKKQ